MQYTSGPPTKMDYARFIAASLFYLAIHNQRDAAGLIVFDEDVREYIRPSTRPGQLARLFAALERAEPRATTDFEIGRASCRERVEISLVAVSVKKKNREDRGDV